MLDEFFNDFLVHMQWSIPSYIWNIEIFFLGAKFAHGFLIDISFKFFLGRFGNGIYNF